MAEILRFAPPPFILGKKEEMTEGRKAGWASKLKPGPLLSVKSGSATASVLLSRCVCSYIKTNGLFQYQTKTTEWFGIFSRMHFVRILCKEYHVLECVGVVT